MPLFKGVAPGAALVGIKVLGANGSGTDAGVISGIQWAVTNAAAHGIDVLNLSLGAGRLFRWNGPDISGGNTAAVSAGLVVVVAAGNAGPDICTVGSPGVAQNVITVGAMADTGVTLGSPETKSRASTRPSSPVAGRLSTTGSSQTSPRPASQITSADANSGGAVPDVQRDEHGDAVRLPVWRR